MRRCASLVLLSLCLVSAGKADVVSFFCLTNNSGGCGLLSPQFKVEVSDAGFGVVNIRFFNEGARAYTSTINYALIDQGSTGLFSGFASPEFSYPSNPPSNVSFIMDNDLTLPGGNGNPWLFTTDFGGKAASPPPQMGVELGESMVIRLALNSGKSFRDVLAALRVAGPAGLRFGIHLINVNIPGAGTGYSESMLSNPVPEPSFLTLLGVGLAGLVVAARRRKQRRSG